METMSEHMERSLKIIIDHLLAKARQGAGLYSRQNPLTWAFDSMKNLTSAMEPTRCAGWK